MKKWNLCVLAMLFGWGLTAQQRDAQLEYVARYLPLALQERIRSGVPVSIKLGQAILESRWGTTDLAVIANNHFGIKCGTTWTGLTYYKEDDDYDAKGRLIPSCFRQFDSPEISFRAHSDFLRDTLKADRYGFLFSIDPLNYKAWAQGLRKAGYATDKSYDVKLIQIIESLELYRYDQPGILAAAFSPGSTASTVYQVFRRPGEAQPLIPLSMCRIRSTNSKGSNHTQQGNSLAGALFFTYRPTSDHPARVLASRSRAIPARGIGTQEIIWHKVRPNELMADISVTYHVRPESLYKRNRLPIHAEVAAGAFVKIQGARVKTAPPLRPEGQNRVVPASIQVMPAVSGAAGSDPFSPIRREKPVSLPISPTKPDPSTSVGMPFPSPGGPLPNSATPAHEESTPDVKAKYHVVKAGETLWSISKKYQLSVDALKKMNRLYDDMLVPGIALRVR